MEKTLQNKMIPTKLSEEQFNEFFWDPYFHQKKAEKEFIVKKYSIQLNEHLLGKTNLRGYF